MKLVKKLNQMRRDFDGIYECEGCQHQQEVSGYDDRYFHDEVTPSMKCDNCGKSTLELGMIIQHTPTKYADHQIV